MRKYNFNIHECLYECLKKFREKKKLNIKVFDTIPSLYAHL